MNNPEALTYDVTNNRLFVDDSSNSRVLVFDTTTITNGENATNVLGQSDFTSNGSVTTQSGMSFPVVLTYDATNNRLFVDDGNNRVLVFDTTTITNGMNAVNVLGQVNFTSSGSATTQSGMSNPAGSAYDATNNRLFVADGSNNRVLVFDTTTITNGENAVDVIGQTDSLGNPVFTTSNALNASANNAGLNYSTGTVLDTVGHRLFVSDSSNNRVLVFNLDVNNNLIDHTADYVLGQSDFTSNGSATTQSGMNFPFGLAYDATNNRLFVADGNNNRVLVFDTTTITNGMNAVNVLGQSDFTSNGSAVTQSGMSFPDAVEYDSVSNRVFVSDEGNSRVLVFDTTTITNGENATNVLGQVNFTSSGRATTQSGMSFPVVLTYDATNNRLFVDDGNNNRVLVFDTTTITNGMNASNLLGQINFTSSGRVTTQSGMSFPDAVEYDSVSNRVFVSDEGNNRVLIFDTTSITDGMNASSVLGQGDFISGGSATTQTGLNDPEIGLTFDPSNNRLYVGDSSSNRVMIFDFVKLGSLPNGTSAASYSQTLTTKSQGTLAVSLISGSLPSGLSISGNIISGTPTGVGTFNFTLKATDTTTVGTFISPAVAYSLTIASPSGGGGGLPAAAYNPPSAPIGGFALSINNNAQSTTSPAINLSLTAGTDAKNMAISNTPDFAGSNQESFSSTKSWNLCWQNGTAKQPETCSPGSYTVYAKFYTSYGQTSPVVSATITYQTSSSSAPSLPSPTPQSFHNGDLVNDHGTIYLIMDGRRIGFTSWNAFIGLGYGSKNVIRGDTSSYRDSSNLLGSSNQDHPWGSWLLSGKTVYYSHQSGLIGVPSWPIFLNNGGKSSFLLPANFADLSLPKALPLLDVNDLRIGK